MESISRNILKSIDWNSKKILVMVIEKLPKTPPQI
jgi:hypothetical protein